MWKLLIRRRFRPLVISVSPNLLPQHCLLVLKGVIRWEIRVWVIQTWPHGKEEPDLWFHRRPEATTSIKLIFGMRRLLPEAGKKVKPPQDPLSCWVRHRQAQQHHSWLPTRAWPSWAQPGGGERSLQWGKAGTASPGGQAAGKSSPINTAPRERTWKNRKLHTQ